MSPGPVTLRLFFDYPTGYKVRVQSSNQSTSVTFLAACVGVSPLVQPTPQSSSNSTTYYLSGGPSELDVAAVFIGRPSSASGLYQSPSIGFLSWTGSFGRIFSNMGQASLLRFRSPVLHRGRIMDQTGDRKTPVEPRRFDFGDKVYLWVEVRTSFS